MKTYGEVEVKLQYFLTSAPFGSTLSASRLVRFTSGKEPPPRIGGIKMNAKLCLETCREETSWEVQANIKADLKA